MSERPGPTPEETNRRRAVPTRIEKESKEFWEGLTPEEKEKMKSRHRSVAQLKRYGAEVTGEGRLEVTRKQIERARKMMEKELSERIAEELETAKGMVTDSEALKEQMEKVNQLIKKREEGRGREEQREVGEQAERAREPVQREGERLSWADQIGAAVEEFGALVDRKLEKWAPRVDALIKRGKELGVKIKGTVASLAEVPARYTEWMVKRVSTIDVEKLERSVASDEEAYQNALDDLIDELEDRIEEKREVLAGDRKLKRIERKAQKIKERVNARYGEPDQPQALEKKEEELNERLAPLRAEWGAKSAELKAELKGFVRREEDRFNQKADELDARYEKAVTPLYKRLDWAIAAKERWEKRAAKARRGANLIRAFLSVEGEEEGEE